MNQIAEHCEAKLHALRKTQDGVVISFVCHPNEIPSGVMLADLGTRYMLAMAEIMDNEQLKSVKANASTFLETARREIQNLTNILPDTVGPKPKRDITLAERVGIFCSSENFYNYIKSLGVYWPAYVDDFPENYRLSGLDNCAAFVRWYCGVKSRSQITYDSEPAKRWKELYESYESWLEGKGR